MNIHNERLDERPDERPDERNHELIKFSDKKTFN